MIIDLISDGFTVPVLLSLSAVAIGFAKASKLTVDEKTTTVNGMVDVAIATGKLDSSDLEAVDAFRSAVSETLDVQYKTRGSRVTMEVCPVLAKAKASAIEVLKSAGDQIKAPSGALELGVYKDNSGKVWNYSITRHPRNSDGSKIEK